MLFSDHIKAQRRRDRRLGTDVRTGETENAFRGEDALVRVLVGHQLDVHRAVLFAYPTVNALVRVDLDPPGRKAR